MINNMQWNLEHRNNIQDDCELCTELFLVLPIS